MLGGPEAIEAGRPTSDLDLLVRERDRSRAAAALRGIGYRPFEPGSVKNHEGLEGQTTNWVDAHSRTVVGLHTHLLHLSILLTIDMDQVWKEAETMTVGGEQALILSSEMRLLHTALHASWTHTYSFGMRWLYDIALILKATEGRLDWQRFLKISSKWRAAGAAYWPLKLAQDLMFVDVPARVLKSIRPLGPGSWGTRWLLKRLGALPGRTRPHQGDDRLAKVLYRHAVMGPGVGLTSRLRLTLHMVFPETRIAAQGHKPTFYSVLAGLAKSLKPSKLRRATRIIFKSLT